MGSKRLDTISDYARHGYALRVECRQCGNIAKLDARAISEDAVKRNLSRDIAAIAKRLRCGKCRKRDIVCGPTFGQSW